MFANISFIASICRLNTNHVRNVKKDEITECYTYILHTNKHFFHGSILFVWSCKCLSAGKNYKKKILSQQKCNKTQQNKLLPLIYLVIIIKINGKKKINKEQNEQ